MILRLLKSVQPVNFILLIIFAILFWAQGLIYPGVYPFFPAETQNLLYKSIHSLFVNSAFFSVLFSLLMAISLAFFVHFINTQFAFIRIRTLLPAPLFIFIIGGLTGIHTLHPVYFATFFMLFAIYRIFRIFENPRPNAAIFDSGLFIGIGVLFYFNLIVVLPAFILALGVLQRATKIRMYIILLLGFILPLIFAFAYVFIFDQTEELLSVFANQFITQNNHFNSNVPLHIFLGFIIILTLTGSIKIIQQYDTKKVSTRKYFTVFFFIFIFSMAGFIFVPAVSHEILIITAIPVCYLIANLLAFMKSNFWGNLIALLFFGIVIYMQIAAFNNG